MQMEGIFLGVVHKLRLQEEIKRAGSPKMSSFVRQKPSTKELGGQKKSQKLVNPLS